MATDPKSRGTLLISGGLRGYLYVDPKARFQPVLRYDDEQTEAGEDYPVRIMISKGVEIVMLGSQAKKLATAISEGLYRDED